MKLQDTYNDKTVMVTGHTGFKGSWMTEWLLLMGARVVGYALEPPTTPSHFAALNLGPRLAADIRADVRSLDALRNAVREHKPDFIFHLAAQPLVRESYDNPHYTMETNFMGTVNLLEALRLEGHPCIVVVVTSDKVYEDVEQPEGYVEDDRIGGHDPYSASKACMEIAISSYRRSFFQNAKQGTRPEVVLASARGGNVVGGGDWSANRIVPDCARHLSSGESILIRCGHATRPWQHVLELVGGYMHLGATLHERLNTEPYDPEALASICSSFNFGPLMDSARTVDDLVDEILKHWPGERTNQSTSSNKHEATLLSLNIDKAGKLLGWRPRWNFAATVENTMRWYRHFCECEDPADPSIGDLTRSQIEAYRKAPSL